jgi:hypothetical protein
MTSAAATQRPAPTKFPAWRALDAHRHSRRVGRLDDHDVRLVVADVDGTLLTPDKLLTPWARAVVRRIIEAGIGFTITSGRPPRGMTMLIDELSLRDPITACNGGLVVRPDLSVIREHVIPGAVARPILDVLTTHTLDVWLYGDRDWYVMSCDRPHVAREQWTVKFPPVVVPTYERLLDRVVKIVGVTDDEEAMACCLTEVQQPFGQRVSACRNRITWTSRIRRPTRERSSAHCRPCWTFPSRTSRLLETCRTMCSCSGTAA